MTPQCHRSYRHGYDPKVAKSKGQDRRRTFRLSSTLDADVDLLAELHHRSANAEMIEALERHVTAHAEELEAYKRRLREK